MTIRLFDEIECDEVHDCLTCKYRNLSINSPECKRCKHIHCMCSYVKEVIEK